MGEMTDTPSSQSGRELRNLLTWTNHVASWENVTFYGERPQWGGADKAAAAAAEMRQ